MNHVKIKLEATTFKSRVMGFERGNQVGKT